jgi:hypothetical protein
VISAHITGNPITLHRYTLIATTTAPAGHALDWSHTASNGAVLTKKSELPFGNVEYEYLPGAAGGVDRIEIKASNKANDIGGEASGLITFTVKANSVPSVPLTNQDMTMPGGRTFQFELPSVDPDGDTVTWTYKNDGDLTAYKNEGGELAISNNVLTGKSPTTEDAYKFTLTATEKFGTQTVATSDHLVKLTVDEGGTFFEKFNTEFTSPSLSGKTAFINLDFPFHLSARNIDKPEDRVVTWQFTRGMGIPSETNPPLAPVFDYELSETLVSANAVKGTLKVGEPGEPTHIKPGVNALHFGVLATFASNAVAYIEYTLDLRDTSPVFWTGTVTEMDTFAKQNIMMRVNNKKDGVFLWDENRYYNQDYFTLKGANDGSMPLSAEIDLTEYNDTEFKIECADLEYGATTFTIELVDAWLGGKSANLAAIKALLADEGTPALYNPRRSEAMLSYIAIPEMPVHGDAYLEKELVLEYEIRDAKGKLVKNKTGGEESFFVRGRFRGNPAPVIDGFADPKTTGNAFDPDEPPFVTWVADQPTIGTEATWTIPYQTTPERGVVSLSFANHDTYGGTYLWADTTGIAGITKAGTTLEIDPSDDLQDLGAEWEITWTPKYDRSMIGDTYSYDLYAFNRYGSASPKFTMTGVLAGNIQNPETETGAAIGVVKEWYYNTGIAKYNPAFDNGDINALSYDFDQRNYAKRWAVSSSPSDGDTNAWSVGPHSGTAYLIGSAIDPERSVGPVISSTNFASTQGADVNVTYAFLKNTETNTPYLDTVLMHGGYGATQDTTLDGESGVIGIVDGFEVAYDIEMPDLVDAGSPDPLYRIRLLDIYEGKTPGDTDMPANFGPEDILQVVFPRIGQKAIFGLTDEDGEPLVDVDDLTYPADAYPISTTWNNIIGWADNAKFEKITMLNNHWHILQADLNIFRTGAPDAALKYQAGADDPAMLSVLHMEPAEFTAGEDGEDDGEHNVWTLHRAALSIGEIDVDADDNEFEYWRKVPSEGKQTHLASFTHTIPTAAQFQANIYRDTFGDALPWLLSYEEDPANMVDTLQVLGYRNTALGAAENPNALPVLVEFGVLAANEVMGDFDYPVKFGPITIPAATNLAPTEPKLVGERVISNRPQWIGESIPVAHYTVHYADDHSGLPGSMGVIAKVADPSLAAGIKLGVETVKGVMITNEVTGGAVPREHSTPIGPYWDEDEEEIVYEDFSAPVIARAMNTANNIAFLTWLNPTIGDTDVPMPISGNVIEFFDGTGGLDDESLPLYRVNVSPDFEYFPIPDMWARSMSSLSEVIVRIRTVRYGTWNADQAQNTMVDFNEEPFANALPAVWADFISAPIKFNTMTGPVWNATTDVKLRPNTVTMTPHNTTFPTDLIWTTNVPTSVLDQGIFEVAANSYKWAIADGAPTTHGLTITTTPVAANAANAIKPAILSWTGVENWSSHAAPVRLNLELVNAVPSFSNKSAYAFVNILSNGWRDEAELDEYFFQDASVPVAETVIDLIDADEKHSYELKLPLGFRFGTGKDTSINWDDTLIVYNWEITGYNAAGTALDGDLGLDGWDISATADKALDTRNPTLYIRDDGTGDMWGYEGDAYIELTLEMIYDTQTIDRIYKFHIINSDPETGTKWGDNLPVFVHAQPSKLGGNPDALKQLWVTPKGPTGDVDNHVSLGTFTWTTPLVDVSHLTVPITDEKVTVEWTSGAAITFEQVGATPVDTWETLAPVITFNVPDDWDHPSSVTLDLEITDDRGTTTIVNSTGSYTIHSNGWRPGAGATLVITDTGEIGDKIEDQEFDIGIATGKSITFTGYDGFSGGGTIITHETTGLATAWKATAAKVGGGAELTGTALTPYVSITKNAANQPTVNLLTGTTAWAAGDYVKFTPVYTYDGVEVELAVPFQVNVIKSPEWDASTTIDIVKPVAPPLVITYTPGQTGLLNAQFADPANEFTWKSNSQIDGTVITSANYETTFNGTDGKMQFQYEWKLSVAKDGMEFDGTDALIPTFEFDTTEGPEYPDLALGTTQNLSLDVLLVDDPADVYTTVGPVYTLTSNGWRSWPALVKTNVNTGVNTLTAYPVGGGPVDRNLQFATSFTTADYTKATWANVIPSGSPSGSAGGGEELVTVTVANGVATITAGDDWEAGDTITITGDVTYDNVTITSIVYTIPIV